MSKEKNKGLMVWVIVLSVLVVGLIGYIIYDKVTDNNDATNNNVVDNNEVTEKNIQVLNTIVGQIIVSKKGETYYIPNEYWDGEEYELKFNSENKNKLGVYDEYTVDGYNEKFKGYKMNLNNMKYAYEIKFGQDITDSILFLNNNGEVTELKFQNAGPTSETSVVLKENVGNYKNIVNIVSSYDSRPVAILTDASGNEYKYYGE